MPKGNRKRSFKAGLVSGAAFAVLIVLVASVGIGLVYQQRYRQEAAKNTKQYAEYSKEKAHQSCVGVPADQFARCAAKVAAESQIERSQYQHDQDDLIAQRQSALWTGVMGIAALVGVGFSIIGVWLVYLSFREARRQANLAEDALSETRRIGRAELRAWLMYGGFTVTPFREGFIDDKPVERGLVAHLTFVNKGKSPAAKARLFSSHKVTKIDAPPPVFTIEGAVREATIGPDWPVNGSERGISAADFDEIMGQRSCLWLYGYATYEDPSHEGDPYETEVTMRVFYNGTEVRSDGTTRDRFNASPEGAQNRLK